MENPGGSVQKLVLRSIRDVAEEVARAVDLEELWPHTHVVVLEHEDEEGVWFEWDTLLGLGFPLGTKLYGFSADFLANHMPKAEPEHCPECFSMIRDWVPTDEEGDLCPSPWHTGPDATQAPAEARA